VSVSVIPSSRRRAMGAGAALALLLALLLALTGCAPTTYDVETARDLQERVAAVSTAAANSDWQATEIELLELEAAATTALARGEVTDARAEAILAAIGLIRADVTQAIEADRIAAEQVAAAERAAAEQAEADRLAAENERSEDDKPGDDKGDGNKDEDKD